MFFGQACNIAGSRSRHSCGAELPARYNDRVRDKRAGITGPSIVIYGLR